ncbi:tetratricopeptide repeat protein [Nitrosovibrio sp. Nv4]|uniref:tetratricopeptide repeat protein n=1 Tax=Nitrosovibrio sp. Nv4 TaxID=1945880 RepID=UPI000BC7DF54|nr:tetratricopeptide repeat protein [Nitrosovibrio sp. Nv4]SOD42039.1 Tetratricopeptide repeat-containing protein [Nitrosovibrio sp. Nv4]
MSAEIRRESLLNAPALMFLSAVLLIVFWILFPRQPAFRDPANLSANDALSVAYLRVLVQSDPHNTPLRLSFVQVLTEAGMTDEAAQAIDPLKRAPESDLTYEIRLAELKLSLQQLYRRPAEDVEAALRARIAELVPSLLRIADKDSELNQVVTLAEQFGDPSVLAETFEQLLVLRDETDEKKSRWLVFAAKQRMAAAQPRLAARHLCEALVLEQTAKKKMEIAKSCLHAYLQAGVDQEALKAAVQMLSSSASSGLKGDAGLLLLAANIAEPMGDSEHALAWLEESSRLLPRDQALAERVLRLQVSMGLLAESLSRAASLRTSLVVGSERHRLLARIYDWNARPDEALDLWLSFARHAADEEAESRAFALARAKPDHAALVQLLEAVMPRRKLAAAEVDAYVKAGLSTAQPSHVEEQLRRHAERFDDPPAIMKALADLLVLQGKPLEAIKVYEEMPDKQNGQQRLALARLYEEAGNAQKSFELLFRESGAPDAGYAEEYWLLLAKVSMQLGKDDHAVKAYEKALVLRPKDVEILEHLQRLAARHHDDKKSERLAHYGWDRLKRVEDLQRLMHYSWARKNWEELDHLLSVAEAQPAIAHAPDYWYFRSIRKMASGDRDAVREALRELLRLRGPEPEVTEAMIWLLLSDKKVDSALLDTVVKPYHNPSGTQPAVSPPLAEALAAAEHTLGRSPQAAARYLQSLEARPRDFLWTLTLADNMEWAGCPANANHVRLDALQMFASQRFPQTVVKFPPRLAEYLFGSKDSLVQHGAGRDDFKKLQSIRERWGFTGILDNADHFALRRQRERLETTAWEAFADAVRKKDDPAVSAQLAAISEHLERQPAGPSHKDMLPLSIDDVDRANRWLAGEAPPNQSDLNKELDVCRQTLTKVRESKMISKPDKEPAKL